MRKTYRGSCHCGAVRFEAEIDLTRPTYRCNCSICRHCGVRCFGVGNAPDPVNRIYGVNLGCLEDVTPQELAAAPIVYVDGKHDRWHEAPAITSYL